MKCKLVSGRSVSMFLFAFALVLAVSVLEAQAGQSRHYEAHEHGVARLNVAVEGADLYLEFTSPAANMVGFEHPPRTVAEKTKVKKAIETLKDGDAMIVLPSGAQGKLAMSIVDTDIDTDESEAGHHHEHQEKQAEADEHKGHSEFKVEYRFVCKNPEKLVHVDVMLMGAFPGIEHIEVQLVTDTMQTALELTATKHRIPF